MSDVNLKRQFRISGSSLLTYDNDYLTEQYYDDTSLSQFLYLPLQPQIQYEPQLALPQPQQQQQQPQQQQQQQQPKIRSTNSNRTTRYRFEQHLFKDMLQLNIKQDKIEKALAATAYQSQNDAINWLIKHTRDQILASEYITPTREFILVLSPTGRLATEIDLFLKESRLRYGPNEAHFISQIPFMKLTTFFKINDSQVLNLHKIFDSLFTRQSKDYSLSKYVEILELLNAMSMDVFSTTQMLLLYLDIDSENLLKELVFRFCQLVSKVSTYDIAPYSKQLHLTLAYQFSPEHKELLEDLATKCINYKEISNWEIRLYSRDARLEGKHTYKVLTSLKSKADSAVFLKVGDYIYVDPRMKDPTSSASMTGISHSNGETVIIAAKNMERSCESETWQLHRTYSLVPNILNNNYNSNESNSEYMNSASISNFISNDGLAKKNSFASRASFFENGKKQMNEMKFVILRHGERIDLVFGPQWIETSFDRNGIYRRINLNMPNSVPQRPSKRDFNGDSPITETGKFQAKLTGEALSNESFAFNYCYVSPALRCVQTAHHILSSMGLEKSCKIRIEPSLFEFLGWYEKGPPMFCNYETLVDFGYNIDTDYKPLMNIERLQNDETYSEYYFRSFNLLKYLTSVHQRESVNILLVGHAATLEVCTRQISGQQIRPYAEFNAIIRKVPYLGCCLLNRKVDQTFEINTTGIQPLSHGATFNFDPMCLR